MSDYPRFFTDEEFIKAYSYGLWFVTHPYFTPPNGDGNFGCTPLVALLLQFEPEFLDKYPLVKMNSNVGGYQVIQETKMGITLNKKIKVETQVESYAIPGEFSFAMFEYWAKDRGCTVEHIMGIQCGAARRTVYYNKGSKVIGVSQPGLVLGTEDFRAGYNEGWLIRDALISEAIQGADAPTTRIELG